MFVLGNLVSALAQIVDIFFKVYSIGLIARILISWVNPDPFNPVVQFLRRVTDPILEPFRKIIPPIGPIDISPMVVFFLLQVLQNFLVRTLIDLSVRLR